MIAEDYVSFEVAKLLKEKGFEEECVYFYDWDEEDEIYRICSNGGSCNSKEYPTYFSMPTLQMAMKWLREMHKISIEITSTGYLIDNDVEWECDIKAGHRLYFKHITNEKSFESCAEEAIKYCLENLI